MSKILFFFFGLLSPLFVQAGLVNICLQNPDEIKQAKYKLREVLHPNDQVFLRESVGCLEISMPAERMELYNSFLKQHFALKNLVPAMTSEVDASSNNICQFQLIRESIVQQDKTELSLGRKTRFGQASAQVNGNSISSLMVNEGKWGMLRLDDKVSYVTCRKIGSQFEVEVSLSSQDHSLSTILTVSLGQRVNIGSIVDDLAHKDRSISLNKGLERHKSSGRESSNFYLVLK